MKSLKKRRNVPIKGKNRMIIKVLKKLNIYTPIKRTKDRINSFFRDKGKFNNDMKQMYKQFVKKGDLCFDIGSATGNRTKVFVELGAREVIAIEPTTYHQKILQRKFKNNNKVILLGHAISNKIGTGVINTNSAMAFATMCQEEYDDVSNDPSLKNLEWIGKEYVLTTTINDLISKYGVPNFIKLDVEGYEVKALQGLSHRVPALSFEYHTLHMDKAIECIDLLMDIGDYEFNYSIRETMVLKQEEWVDSINIKKLIEKEGSNVYSFGDVYCRLIKEEETTKQTNETKQM